MTFALAILRCQATANCDPRAFAEKIAEHHFSKVKRPFTGCPSIRDCILSTQRLHLQNLRAGDVAQPMPCEEAPMTEAAMKALASLCLQQSLHFLAWISTFGTPQEIREVLESWWNKGGMSFISRRAKKPDEDSDSDSEDDVGIEDDVPWIFWPHYFHHFIPI